MSKLLNALIAAGFALGLNAAMAQNVDSDKDKAQGQDKLMRDKEQGAKHDSTKPQQGQVSTDKRKAKPTMAQPQSAKASRDCANANGKEKEKCIQVTPAGTVDMRTGEKSQAKSADAKERDRENADKKPNTNAPAQSSSAVGHPQKKSTTGEGQTADGVKNTDQSQSAKNLPAQSKGTVGHPEQRTTTGEGQSGQEAGATTSPSASQKLNK